MVSETDQQVTNKNETCDMIVLDYINKNNGTLRLSNAVRELGMSKEQIAESVRRLMAQNLVNVNETSSTRSSDALQSAHENENPFLPQIPDSQVVSSTRIYGCENCGWPIHTFPPDDVHRIADGRALGWVGVVEIKYVCSRCREVKRLYWRRPLTVTLPMTLGFRFREGIFVPICSRLLLGLRTLRAYLGK